MTKSTNALATGLCLLSFATMSVRADTVAENLNGGLGTVLPSFVGQSFTTGPATYYTDLAFNFYSGPANPTTVPVADPGHTYYLLSQAYLGTHGGLGPSTPGYIASTTGVSGDQWLFDPYLALDGDTQYWVYGTGTPIGSSFAVGGGDPYSGGQFYKSGAGLAPYSVQTGLDLAFTLDGTAINPSAMAEVVYDTPVIDEGPISFGLTELPAAPGVTFALRDGTPAGGGATHYGIEDVIAADIIFGDLSVIEMNGFISMNGLVDLTSFSMEVNAGGVTTALSYVMELPDTDTAEGPVVLNFPFTVTGTDINSGEAFSYTYANSAATVTPVLIAGDLDGDGFVGINDLNIVLANWNQNIPPADPLADPSGDGFVGIDDLNEVLGNWNAGTPPTAQANIPEPAGLLILLSPVLLRRRPSPRLS